MNDLYFWLGEDGSTDLVDPETFEKLQQATRTARKRWQEVSVTPVDTYFFYGILEPDNEEDEDELEANDKWDDLLNYGSD